MSYILEALKKAQAERQIGSTPTIHAPTLASVPAGQGARSKRTSVIIAMALMAAAIAGLAMMLLRQPAAKTTAVPQALATTPAAVASNAPAAAVPHSTAGAPTAAVPTAAPLVAVPRSADAGVPPPVALSTSAPGVANTGTPQPAAPSTAASQAANAAVPVTTARQAPMPQAPEPPRLTASQQAVTGTRGADAATAMAPVEEHVQSLQELPEPIQRAIPQISLGGYMYSRNPADRLLLIDKVLRREGEEVAPGLVLDKLLPKQAIFSFRGYRYRVPL